MHVQTFTFDLICRTIHKFYFPSRTAKFIYSLSPFPLYHLLVQKGVSAHFLRREMYNEISNESRKNKSTEHLFNYLMSRHLVIHLNSTRLIWADKSNKYLCTALRCVHYNSISKQESNQLHRRNNGYIGYCLVKRTGEMWSQSQWLTCSYYSIFIAMKLF